MFPGFRAAAGPLEEATFPGTSPVTAVGLTAGDTGGLLTTGLLTDRATATSASSTVANVDATLLTAGLTATTVMSTCTFHANTGTVSGTTTLADGVVNLLLTTVHLAAHPTINDTVLGVGGIGSITLNAQSTAGDGTLTVTAIRISLRGGQTISLGVSVCNTADLAPVPVLPGKALPVAGGLGALMIAGVGYEVTRRRRAASAR